MTGKYAGYFTGFLLVVGIILLGDVRPLLASDVVNKNQNVMPNQPVPAIDAAPPAGVLFPDGVSLGNVGGIARPVIRRVSWGEISPSGPSISNPGSGDWAVSSSQLGYTIFFPSGFASRPVCLFTPLTAIPHAVSFGFAADTPFVGSSQITVSIFNAAGSASPTVILSFICIQ